MQRRDLLKALAVTALLPGAPTLQLKAAEPDAPLYFSKEEFVCLDQLTEMIIPADSHSPGAHTAGVATFIDKTVAQSFLIEDKTSWSKGLAPYLPLNRDQRLARLTELAPKAEDPHTDAEKFFAQLKESTAFAYYTSKIGIHDDIQYIGNVIQEQFSGHEAS